MQLAESIIQQVQTEFLSDKYSDGFPINVPSQAYSDQDAAKNQWNPTGLDDLWLQALNGYCCPLCGSSAADTERCNKLLYDPFFRYSIHALLSSNREN